MLLPTLEMYIKEFVSVETLISYPMSMNGRLNFTQDNMKEYMMLLLLAVCSAKPFSSPSHTALKNMMLKDTEDTDDDDDDNSLFPTKEPVNPFFPFDLFPTCPFGCQCYSRVVHCSDLGKDSSQFCFEEYCYSEKVKRIKKRRH